MTSKLPMFKNMFLKRKEFGCRVQVVSTGWRIEHTRPEMLKILNLHEGGVCTSYAQTCKMRDVV